MVLIQTTGKQATSPMRCANTFPMPKPSSCASRRSVTVQATSSAGCATPACATPTMTIASSPQRSFKAISSFISSIGFMIDADTPMVWRGPMVTQALEQLLKDTNWREVDYLIVDMPPGTGDIQLTLAQKVPVTGAVIVTTPQDIALIDARKGLKMFEKVGVPIVGVVENMSIHICSNCGHAEHIFGEGGAQKMCNDYSVPFLGRAAARHPHPRAGGLGPADGRRRSRRQGGADLPGDRAQGRDLGGREGGGFLGEVPEHRRPEHVRRPRGGASMTIKSDRWIRRMAAITSMIEPFEPGQVREVDGRKIVSYGTSSYGYDIRCSRRIQDLHQHQLDHRRSQGVRRRARSSTSRATSASFRPTRSRWRARSSISAFRATCSRSASARARTRAAASSST